MAQYSFPARVAASIAFSSERAFHAYTGHFSRPIPLISFWRTHGWRCLASRWLGFGGFHLIPFLTWFLRDTLDGTLYSSRAETGGSKLNHGCLLSLPFSTFSYIIASDGLYTRLVMGLSVNDGNGWTLVATQEIDLLVGHDDVQS